MGLNVEDLIDLLDFKLTFSTVEGQFEGILKFIKLKEKRVTFEHTYYLPSRKYIGTVYVKFRKLLSYKILEKSTEILDASKLSAVGELPNGDIEKSSRVDESAVLDEMKNETVTCPDDLPSHLKILCPDDFCIIDSVCPAFFRAINHISGLDTIGLSLHGYKISRNGSLSWLCIATSPCIFMFDIGSMGIEAFHRGLRNILEDKLIEKVVHDCREPADCLKHLFQTTLQNVFDTQVADYLINMQRYSGKGIFKYVSSLDSCLVKYLKLPQEFLFNRNKCLSQEDEIEFHKIRPVDEDFTQVLLKSAIYLVALKDKQKELLLYPYHEVVDLYLNIIRDASEAEVARLSDKFTQIAPPYLVKCVKSVRFYDLPLPADDTLSKFRQTRHGEEIWSQRMRLQRFKDSSS